MTPPPAVCTVGWYMNTTTHDTPAPAATQRPANLVEAIGLLSTKRGYSFGPVPVYLQFVQDLISEYPHLVLREIVTRRSDYIAEVLGSYRGEV